MIPKMTRTRKPSGIETEIHGQGSKVTWGFQYKYHFAYLNAYTIKRHDMNDMGHNYQLRPAAGIKFSPFSLPEKGKSVSSENDEAVMDDIHSISSEASLTDNIPNLVTSELSPGQLRRKIENKSKKILENFRKMKITKQKYYDDRGRFKILSLCGFPLLKTNRVAITENIKF